MAERTYYKRKAAEERALAALAEQNNDLDEQLRHIARAHEYDELARIPQYPLDRSDG